MPSVITPCSGAYSVVQDEGAALTRRNILDFVGAGVTATDDAGGLRTLVTIPGGAGAFDLIYGPVPLASPANFDFTAIPATYRHLKLVGVLRGTDAASSIGVALRYNGTGGVSYHYSYLVHTAAAATPQQAGASGQPAGFGGGVPGAGAAGAYFGSFEATIFDYTSTAHTRETQSRSALFVSTALASMLEYFSTSWFASTAAAISRVEVLPQGAGTWDTGSELALYGLTG